ncbi:hypothetical protein SADUNF_Sadunf06G0145300 [Salix dunnii]|uniref:Uncharacterized protein n=1 Tax=Salix dunnii TaxID=1413687 RepID=A0A835K4U6_9ROSI|nr:hypothetical protein SADUNF_Sadunf06G0145300 [Salix dunnii]
MSSNIIFHQLLIHQNSPAFLPSLILLFLLVTMQGEGRSKGHLWLLLSSNLVLTLLILGIVDLGISFEGISMFSGWQRTASVSSSQWVIGSFPFNSLCLKLRSGHCYRMFMPLSSPFVLREEFSIRISMEEETVSLVLNAETSAIEEFSDSNSSTHPFPPSKRARSGGNVSASKFKGVVPQPNGHWGCQIYANHLRIWLGTFKSEKEAAMAYDSAAIKLRSGDSRRNFPPTDLTVEEPKFQSYYSTEVVLSMIKDGTYQSKFADFIRTCSQSVETELGLKLMMPQSGGGLKCKQLFQKELTPSDVGKLNRLVIPKKYAIKYFPHVSESAREDEAADKIDDVMLAFYDKSMKLWKFRYCYWKSSQSYVFTRGWNRFVKEKKLKANDTIAFCLCEAGEIVDSTAQTFQMIDVGSCENSSNAAESSSQSIASEVELQLLLGPVIARDSTVKKNVEEDRMVRDDELAHDAVKTGFKLFGIQIM